MADISLEAIAAALNIDAAELNKLAKNGDAEVPKPDLEAAVAAKIKGHITDTLTTVKTGAFDEGHGKATREVLSAKERNLRAKFPNLEGKDLDEIVENAIKGTGSTDWTKNPAVAKELQTREDLIAQKDAEIEKLKGQYNRDLTTVKLKSVLPKMLDELGFQIPEDPKRQAKLMKTFYDDFLRPGVEIREEGEGSESLIPWDTEKNTQLKTSDYKPVTLKDWAKANAEAVFDLKTVIPHKAPNNKDGDPAPVGGSSFDFSALTSWQAVYDYKKGIKLTDKDAQDKLKALDTYVAANSGKFKD